MLKKRVYVALNGGLEEDVARELSRWGLAPMRFGRRGDLSRKLAEDPPDALLIEPDADLQAWDPGALLSLQFPAPTLLVLPPSMLPKRGDVLQSGAADVIFRPADPRDVAERVTSLLGYASSVGARWLVNHPVVLEVSGEDAIGRTVELSRQRALVLLNAPVPLGAIARLTLTSPLGPPLVIHARTLFCRDAREPTRSDGRARLLVGLRLVALSTAESLALGHLCRVGRSSTSDGRHTPPPLSEARSADAPRVRVTLGDARPVGELRGGTTTVRTSSMSSSRAGSTTISTPTERVALPLDDSPEVPSSEGLQLVDFWDVPVFLPRGKERTSAVPGRDRSSPRRSSTRVAVAGAWPDAWDSHSHGGSPTPPKEDDWPDPTPMGSSSFGADPVPGKGADANTIPG